MFLRKLTDKELEHIKKSKDAIKEQRHDLNGDIKKQRRKIKEETKRLKGKIRTIDMYQPLKILQDHLCDLQNQFNALPIITGLPVIVNVDGASLYMNYALLNEAAKSLNKSNFWQYHFKINEGYLIIRYKKHGQSGAMELLEAPAYKTELLTGLPIIDLKE